VIHITDVVLSSNAYIKPITV